MCSTDIFLALLAVLFPPLPVWVKRGLCSADSILNILLFILGYIPGLLHAWYIIAKYPEPPYDYDYQQIPPDAEHGRIYVFVHNGGHGQSPHQQGYQQQSGAQPRPQGHMNYGTAGYAAPGSQQQHQQQQRQQQQQHSPQEQGTAPGPSTGAAGPSDGSAPPSYAQVVAGDHKVQTHD